MMMYSPPFRLQIDAITLPHDSSKYDGLHVFDVVTHTALFNPNDCVGFLAGEFPHGATTVNGVPSSARVKVLHRAPGLYFDGMLVQSSVSGASGAWLIQGLSHSLKYDVVGQLDGHCDVVKSSVAPVRSDLIVTLGNIESNEEFDGATGSITLESGLPPFSVNAINALPNGLRAVILEGRNLIIDGVTSDYGYWEPVLLVSSVNGVSKEIPLHLGVGFFSVENPILIYSGAQSAVVLKWGEIVGVADEIEIYRSGSPIPEDHTGAPFAVIAKSLVEFYDTTVAPYQTYHYRIVTKYNGRKRWTKDLAIFTASDVLLDKVISASHFNGVPGTSVFDVEIGPVKWSLGGTAALSANNKFGDTSVSIGASGSINSTPDESMNGLQDFTIDFWMYGGGRSCLFSVDSSTYLYNNSLWLGGYSNSLDANLDFGNSWSYVVICRSGDIVRIFQNGLLKSKRYGIYAPVNLSGILFGHYKPNGNLQWDGLIDDLRITAAARYSEDDSFIPPTTEFPAS